MSWAQPKPVQQTLEASSFQYLLGAARAEYAAATPPAAPIRQSPTSAATAQAQAPPSSSALPNQQTTAPGSVESKQVRDWEDKRRKRKRPSSAAKSDRALATTDGKAPPGETSDDDSADEGPYRGRALPARDGDGDSTSPAELSAPEPEREAEPASERDVDAEGELDDEVDAMVYERQESEPYMSATDEEYNPGGSNRKGAPKKKQRLSQPGKRAPYKVIGQTTPDKFAAPGTGFARAGTGGSATKLTSVALQAVKREEESNAPAKSASPRSRTNGSEVGAPRRLLCARSEGRFIDKIHAILRDPAQYGDVIRWDTTGTVVMIAHKEPRLVEVLEEKFGHRTFTAFGRQFAVYGFRALARREVTHLTPAGSGVLGQDASTLRAWVHTNPDTFTSSKSAHEVTLIPVIPSKARREAKEKREAAHKAAGGVGPAPGTPPPVSRAKKAEPKPVPVPKEAPMDEVKEEVKVEEAPPPTTTTAAAIATTATEEEAPQAVGMVLEDEADVDAEGEADIDAEGELDEGDLD